MIQRLAEGKAKVRQAGGQGRATRRQWFNLSAGRSPRRVDPANLRRYAVASNARSFLLSQATHAHSRQHKQVKETTRGSQHMHPRDQPYPNERTVAAARGRPQQAQAAAAAAAAGGERAARARAAVLLLWALGLGCYRMCNTCRYIQLLLCVPAGAGKDGRQRHVVLRVSPPRGLIGNAWCSRLLDCDCASVCVCVCVCVCVRTLHYIWHLPSTRCSLRARITPSLQKPPLLPCLPEMARTSSTFWAVARTKQHLNACP
jgi:hypothetical protein